MHFCFGREAGAVRAACPRPILLRVSYEVGLLVVGVVMFVVMPFWIGYSTGEATVPVILSLALTLPLGLAQWLWGEDLRLLGVFWAACGVVGAVVAWVAAWLRGWLRSSGEPPAP